MIAYQGKFLCMLMLSRYIVIIVQPNIVSVDLMYNGADMCTKGTEANFQILIDSICAA